MRDTPSRSRRAFRSPKRHLFARTVSTVVLWIAVCRCRGEGLAVIRRLPIVGFEKDRATGAVAKLLILIDDPLKPREPVEDVCLPKLAPDTGLWLTAPIPP